MRALDSVKKGASRMLAAWQGLQPASKIGLSFFLLLLFVFYSFTNIWENDDSQNYFAFVQTLVHTQQVDFGMPGFQGMSWFAALIYMLTGSPVSISLAAIFFSYLSVLAIFFAVRAIFGDESTALTAAFLYFLIPWLWAQGPLGGNTETAQTFFFFATLYLLFRGRRFAFVPFVFAVLTKGFSVALIPFFVYKRRWKDLFLGFAILGLYACFTFLASGRFFMAADKDAGTFGLFNIPKNVFDFTPFLFYFQIYGETFNPYVFMSPLVFVLAIFYVASMFSSSEDRPLKLVFAVTMVLSYVMYTMFEWSDLRYALPLALVATVAAARVLVRNKAMLLLISVLAYYPFRAHQELSSRPWPGEAPLPGWSLGHLKFPYVLYLILAGLILYAFVDFLASDRVLPRLRGWLSRLRLPSMTSG